MSGSLITGEYHHLPLIAPADDASTRESYYETALDVMTLDKVDETNSDSVIVPRYEFRIESNSADYKKLFMPANGTIYFYPSGATLPNGITATADTLLFKPEFDTVTNWQNHHPHYSAVASEWYFGNLDIAVVTEKLKQFIEPDYLPLTFVEKYVQAITDEADWPIGDEAYRTSYFDAFSSAQAGVLGIYVPGGEEIGELATDGTSTTVFRLDMYVTNHKHYPRKSGEDDYETMVGAGTEESDVYDSSETATFFRFHQRIEDPDVDFAPLTGHPMITLLVSADQGLDTASLTASDRTTVKDWAVWQQIDIVNLASDKTQKYDVGSVDRETEHPVVVAGGPVSTADRTHYPDDDTLLARQPKDSGTIQIYCPDGIVLDAAATEGNIVIDWFSNSGRDGYYELGWSIDSSITAASPVSEDVIEIRIDSSTGALVMEVHFLILPFKLLSTYHFRIGLYTTFSDGTRTGDPRYIVSEYNSGPKGNSGLLNANIGVYTVNEDPEDVEFEWGYDDLLIYNDDGTDSDFLTKCISEAHSGAINVFYVDKVDKSTADPLVGICITRSSGSIKTTYVFVENFISIGDPTIEAHELIHAITQRHMSSSDLVRHFDHDGDEEGDYALKNNLMISKNAVIPIALTSNQVRILNEAL